MKRFVEEVDRGQRTLFPECLEDWIVEDIPVRVIDVFVDELALGDLGFSGVDPEATGRPSYHPSVLLKLYIYGYLNRVQSSRRLEREAARNVEVMWLIGRLVPDHKTIADFRKDNGKDIRQVCARFVDLCREIGLLTTASVAIDGSKFKAVNNRDKNFTRGKAERRRRNSKRVWRAIWISSTQANSTHIKMHRSASGGKRGSRNRRLAAHEEGAIRRSMHWQMLRAVFFPSS
jgi:transposase